MRNEHGFITPFALAIVLIFTVYCSYQLQLLKSEQLFLNEMEKMIVLETLMQRGIVDIISEINTRPSQSFSGTFTYEDGQVNYNISFENESMYVVTMSVAIVSGTVRNATFHYDNIQKTVIEWQEANVSESIVSYGIYGSRKNYCWSVDKS
ncbi:hypothetical protein CIB95_04615 [Lottiidibacillus patelloidae]|uniref:Competence protein ComGG n=1 Tax=Lottiidibacillus patelloidae TaxID=2670334 RepID=A0A263BVS0_9BACI|nr:competence type IV pilus minor pilin ComGG [Lottiidibacillus patelloidae]OZM57658.1 hypothetical protein CIB95_04615 [Lottiidibacillus patelloidae]